MSSCGCSWVFETAATKSGGSWSGGSWKAGGRAEASFAGLSPRSQALYVFLKLLGLVHSLPLNAGTNPLLSHHLCVSSFLATESSSASSISKNRYSISSPLSSHQLRTSICPCRVATMRTSLSNTSGKRECFHQSRRGTLPVFERW